MFGSLFDREQRALSTDPWGGWQGDYNPTWSGSHVDTTTAMQLLTVYGCVQFICNGISTLPLDVIRDTGTEKVHLPTPDWLEYPQVGVHRVGWLTQLLTSLLLDGNAYLAITRNPTGQILELVPIDPAAVDIRREQGRRVFYVNGNVPKTEILHVPAIMKAGSEKGMSPVEAAR
jgi:HK97 family phage portal protein